MLQLNEKQISNGWEKKEKNGGHGAKVATWDGQQNKLTKNIIFELYFIKVFHGCIGLSSHGMSHHMHKFE